jgi:hypothetical protein
MLLSVHVELTAPLLLSLAGKMVPRFPRLDVGASLPALRSPGDWEWFVHVKVAPTHGIPTAQ